MYWLLLLAMVPSLLIAAVAVPTIRRRAESWGLVARPCDDRFHRETTPLGGGLAIWGAVVATFAVGQIVLWMVTFGAVPYGSLPEFVRPHIAGLVAQSPRLWILLGLATLMMVLGLVDDRRHLIWPFRLLMQIVIASLAAWQGWRLSLFIDDHSITLVLSVLWIVGIVNAFNFLDNMDGLASGVAWIAAVLLAIVMLTAPDPEANGPQLFVAGFLIVLAGALAGFWWHNRPPATIFMGDAGSYFVGFCLATATLMATFAGGNLPRHAILAPLCVLAVPIYDTASVVLIRLRQGRSPFDGDKNHFSHRLVELGLSPKQAVWTIYLLTTACGLGALLLHKVNAAGAVVILLMITCTLATSAILETTARRKR